MPVTVKTLDGNNHLIEVNPEETIAAFKRLIAERLDIPVERQRIIFQGRILNDSVTVRESGIENCVVHLVTRSPQNNASPNPPRSAASNAGRNEPGPTNVEPGVMVDMVQNALNSMFQSQIPYLATGQRTNLNANEIHLDVLLPPQTHGNLGDRAGTSSNNLSQGQPGGSDENDPVNVHFSVARLRQRYIMQSFRNNIEPLLQRLDELAININAATSSENPADGRETPVGVEQPTAAAPTPPTAAQSTAASNSNMHQPLEISALADLMEVMESHWNRLSAHLPYFRRLLRVWTTRETTSESNSDIARDQEFYDTVSRGMHFISHILHNLSDLMVDLNLPAPRYLLVLSGVTHQQVMETTIEVADASTNSDNAPDASNPPNESAAQSRGRGFATRRVIHRAPHISFDGTGGDLGSLIRRMNVSFGAGRGNMSPSTTSSTTPSNNPTAPTMTAMQFGPAHVSLLPFPGISTQQPEQVHVDSTSSSSQSQSGDESNPMNLPSIRSVAWTDDQSDLDPYLLCDSRHRLPLQMLIRNRNGEDDQRVPYSIPILAAISTTLPMNLTDMNNGSSSSGINTSVTTNPQGENNFDRTNRRRGAMPLFRRLMMGSRPIHEINETNINNRPNVVVTPSGTGVNRGQANVRNLLMEGEIIMEQISIALAPNQPSIGSLIQQVIEPTSQHRSSEIWRQFFTIFTESSSPTVNIAYFHSLMESWLHRLGNERITSPGFSTFLPSASLLRSFDSTRLPFAEWLENAIRSGENFSPIQPESFRELSWQLALDWVHWIERDWLMSLEINLARMWLSPLVILCRNHIIRILQLIHTSQSNIGFGPLLWIRFIRWQLNLCQFLRIVASHSVSATALRANTNMQDFQVWLSHTQLSPIRGRMRTFLNLTEDQEIVFASILQRRWLSGLGLTASAPRLGDQSRLLINYFWQMTHLLYHCVENGFVTSNPTHLRHLLELQEIFGDTIPSMMLHHLDHDLVLGGNESLFREDAHIWNLNANETEMLENFLLHRMRLLSNGDGVMEDAMRDAMVEVIARDMGYPSSLGQGSDAVSSEGGYATPSSRMDMEGPGEEVDNILTSAAIGLPLNDPLAPVRPLTEPSSSVTESLLQQIGLEAIGVEQARLLTDELSRNWLPVIAADVARLSSSVNNSARRPSSSHNDSGAADSSTFLFSDAYIAGMPAKRRKLMEKQQAKNARNCEAILQDCLDSARAQVNPGALPNVDNVSLTNSMDSPLDNALTAAFREYVSDQIAERLSKDEDFDSDRFPLAAHKFYRGNDADGKCG